MEPLTVKTAISEILSGFFILVAIAIPVFIFCYGIWEFSGVYIRREMKREDAFNELHDDIEDNIRIEANYTIILDKLKRLEAMKYNSEKVSVLRYKLNQKFEFKK